jgi:nitrite reductase (NO-forming)
MIRNLLLFIPIIALLSASSCKQGTNSGQKDDQTHGVMSSPRATVTTTPDTARTPVGPLAYGLNVPQTMDQDTIDVKIDVAHHLFQVTRDVAFTAWEFGGSVPGPTLKVRVGQTVRFSMTNRSNEALTNVGMTMQGKQMHAGAHNMDSATGPMPHSIDFHAAMVNPEDKYRTVYPGETIHFTWTANYPGVFMYHCGTPMVLMHMIYGMIGMVIVEPKGGFPDKVDTAFALVQNEFYLKKKGTVYIPDTAIARLKQPTYVAFNGKPAQYVVNPIRVKAGERIRIYLLNAGPNNATAFHVIGTILDKVWIDGNPHNEMQGLQSVYLGPASGAIVDFVLPEKGLYTFVDHSFADAEMGAIGTFKAE